MSGSNPAPGFVDNPSKVITIEPYHGRVVVTAGGTEIANSSDAKVLTEAPYPSILYIPFADIDFAKLAKTDHSTRCPFKGNASYWSVSAIGESGVNAMWAYEAPYDETIAIKDHGAFYPNKVTIQAQ